METWEQMAKDALKAAQRLRTQGHWRSSVSRSFYAAYSAATAELRKTGLQFRFGRLNPSPQVVHKLVKNHLGRKQYSQQDRRVLGESLWRLYNLRIVADYIPGRAIEKRDVLAGLHDAALVLRRLGVL